MRCGTSFLLIVMIIAVFVFAPIGRPALHWLILSRILGIALVAASGPSARWAGAMAWRRAMRCRRCSSPMWRMATACPRPLTPGPASSSRVRRLPGRRLLAAARPRR